MRHLNTCLTVLILVLAPSSLRAEQPVEEAITASPDATVQIENIAGSVRVTGWDENRVQVTGTLGDDVEELSISKSGDEIYIEVELDHRSDHPLKQPWSARARRVGRWA